MTVTVYSKPACVQCTATYRALDAQGIQYEIFDVTADEGPRDCQRPWLHAGTRRHHRRRPLVGIPPRQDLGNRSRVATVAGGRQHAECPRTTRCRAARSQTSRRSSTSLRCRATRTDSSRSSDGPPSASPSTRPNPRCMSTSRTCSSSPPTGAATGGARFPNR